MTELDVLRQKVKEKKKLEAEQAEKLKLEAELEKGTVRGIAKTIGKGLFKKLMK